VRADVLAIDAALREVKASGGILAGEHLVIALGAELDLAAVPGLEASAHTFYTLEGASRLHESLAAFGGGRIVLLIPKAPFQCPPAPYEAALMLHAWLEHRGLRDKTSIDVWTVEKAPMATAGPEMGKLVVGELNARRIGFHPLEKTVSVDAAKTTVHFEGGGQAAFDLLIAIPPHRVPRVIADSGLADPGGWISVDPLTLAVRSPKAGPHVYAIGDATSVALPGRWAPDMPLALPKAGAFAAAQGEVVAANIASVLKGGSPDAAFDARGQCFLEVGNGRAMRAEGNFFEMPHPVMSAAPADEAQYREKSAWVAEWLAPARA
jgi:sulfide:quinone oxidoreductase